MTAILAFLLATSLALLTCCATPPHRTVRLPRGGSVPVHVLQARLPAVAKAELHTKVFQVHNNRFLHTHGGAITDLHKVAPHERVVHSHPRLVVRLNGVEQPKKKFHGLVRTGDKFTVAMDADRRVLHVWANGMQLSPLSLRSHPGVFVNMMKESQTDNLSDAVHVNDEENIKIEFSNSLTADVGVEGPEGNTTYKMHYIAERQADGDPSCAAAGTARETEIAIAIDNTLCSMNYDDDENTASVALNSFLAIVEAPYREKTCVRMVMTHLDAHCNNANDPYAALNGQNANGILRGFRQIWSGAPYTSVERDYALLISGFHDGTSSSGLAYFGVICDERFSVGWSEGLWPAISIHEIGHSFGARHTTEGIMHPSISIPNPGGRFSDFSTAQINSFVDSRGSSCMALLSTPPSTAPPIIKATPSPTPTPRPTSGDGTCAGALNRSVTLNCLTESTSKHNTISGEVNTTLSASNNEFKFSFELLTHDKVTVDKSSKSGKRFEFTYHIMVVGVELSMNGPQEVRTLSFGGGVKYFSFTINPSSIALRGGTQTCCDGSLFVVQHIVTRLVVTDSAGRRRTWTHKTRTWFAVAFPCLTCDEQSILIRATSRTECPRCMVAGDR